MLSYQYEYKLRIISTIYPKSLLINDLFIYVILFLSMRRAALERETSQFNASHARILHARLL